MDKYIGKRLDGRYEIRELIGVGGMANVYKAFDLVENRLVAVKVLRDEYMDNDELLRRFRNESKAVATLSHPNIVKVYDVSFSQKMHSIVMEYIDGITLKEFIDQQGILGWKETVHFTVQILRALQHAHDNGIVHRDIKPQNMMLLSDGTIKVTDFGIARFARSNTRTITDRAIGSVHYISPEQAQGGTIDEKTDIYSVGVMMYEMLTGKLPFDADTPVSVALKQIQLEPTRPTALNPEIPVGLEAITMRAMQKEPARRYQSAAEMLRDIDEFKRNPSINFSYKYMGEPSEHPGAQGGTELSKKDGRTRAHTRVQEVSRAQQEVQEMDEDEEEEKPRIPFLSVLTGITFAFVLVSAIFVGTMFYFNNPFETVESIKTPDLVGQKFSAAKYDSFYTDNKIQLIPTSDFNDQYANGVIFEQEPKSGRPIKQGGTIEVKVSAGAKTITLMDLSGMESNEAYAVLSDKGLQKYEETLIYDDSVAEGYVVKTDPEPNTQVDGQTEIMVYVSMGRENQLINVPDVRGMKLSDAKRFLENADIIIGRTTTVQSEDYEKGTIVAQVPEPDTSMPQGSSIDVEVSGGNEETKKVGVTIDLPPVSALISVEAWLDGVMVHNTMLTPGAEGGKWREVYEGYGVETLEIRINGALYQAWEVDFDEATRALLVDNTADFQSGVPALPSSTARSTPEDVGAKPADILDDSSDLPGEATEEQPDDED